MKKRNDWPFVWTVLALAAVLLCAGVGAAQGQDERWQVLVENQGLSEGDAKDVVAVFDRTEALAASAGVRCNFGDGDGDRPTVLFDSDLGEGWGQLVGNVGVSAVFLHFGPAAMSALELHPAGNVNVVTVYGRLSPEPAPSDLSLRMRTVGASPAPLVAVWSRTTQHLGHPMETQTRGECAPIPGKEGN